MRALIACDLTFSAHAGAAIGLVPVGGAEAAIEDGKLTDTLAENLYEVLNIAASMFNVVGADHLKPARPPPRRPAARPPAADQHADARPARGPRRLHRRVRRRRALDRAALSGW
ncbi:hypothetical protein G5V59_12575 [Nocardioides sp. W3-2-3]|uniref:hypothetical protein n=1 Tax=Nocardioides convexus TaxID=2712224 RepID=UPI00241881BB|nr:hypothetical protein [Nocardioides convexus]NHA00575.1 hypothetical protein [Nocardioides convexus]